MENVICNHEREIIFSSSPISTTNPENLKNEFHSGDKIYAVACLSHTVRDLYPGTSPSEKLQVEIHIYEITPPLYEYQSPMETQIAYAGMAVSGSIKESKLLVIDLVPDPMNTTAYGNSEIMYNKFGKNYEGPVDFANAIAQLAPGRHQLKVVVNCNYSPVAEGEFTLHGNDFSIYATLANQINDAALNAGTASATFPKPVVTDTQRELQRVNAFTNSNDWKTGWIDGTEVLKTAITYDWEIRRHEISGAILHRYCIAAIAFKTRDGGCAYRMTTFQEDYFEEKFQPLKYDGAGDKVTLNCNKMNY
jgi:hypothetical protein